MRQPDHQHFDRRRRLRRGAHLAVALQQHLPRPSKPRDSHLRQIVDGCLFGLQQRIKRSASGLLAGAMNKVHQVGDDHLGLGAARHRCRQGGQRAGGVSLHGRIEDCDRVIPPGPAQHVGDAGKRHTVRRHRRRLVQKRQRVADRAFGGAGDGGDGLAVCRDGFLFAYGDEMRRQPFGSHASQIKALAA